MVYVAEQIVCHPYRCHLTFSPDTEAGRASNGSCISNRRGQGLYAVVHATSVLCTTMNP